MQGSIGPVSKTQTQGEEGTRGGGRGGPPDHGQRRQHQRGRGDSPRKRGGEKEERRRGRKAKEAESLTSKNQPGRLKKISQRHPPKGRERQTRRRQEEERKKEQENGHGGSRSEAPQASAGVLPMKCHRQPLQEHSGAGVFGHELA